MTAEPDYFSLDATVVKDVILANRKHFVKYNITRLRELIRYLPARKLDLFYSIPLLLHINSPDYPGYVDDALIPHGIYGFYDSGFWTLAKRRLGIDMKDIRACVSKIFYIKGIYLMGSAGSLGQASHSDFDYWVVIDKESIGERQRTLLRVKLQRIEQWAEETYGHHLTFFVLDAIQIQNNAFSGIDEEGLRTGQQSLLKEEFYRTFILIGGQIPYWAVLPVGLGDSEYKAWVEAAASIGVNGFSSDDYIDLGNLTSVNQEECYGALLWQFCKAQDDPVKALIKTSLMVQHVFFQQGQGLLCDITKKRFPGSRLDSYFLDPYALVFDRVLKFYEEQGDRDGLDLIRQCIYFRIIGFPMPAKTGDDDPKNEVLKRYVREWSWGKSQTERLENYLSWTENEKLEFETQIIGKLWHLYGLVFQSTGNIGFETGMSSVDLDALKHKAASRFKKKKGKLSFASVHMRTQQDGHTLFVVNQQAAGGSESWVVFDGLVKGARKPIAALFTARELLRVLGWIVFNGLYKGKRFAVDFQHIGSPVPQGRAKKLLEEVISCFSGRVPPQGFRRAEPQWLKVFVALDPSRFVENTQLHTVDYLVQNTWGEMFFYSQDLRHVRNKLLKHHEIAKRIWHYLRDADPDQFCYRVFDLRTVEDPTTVSSIEEFVADLRKADAKEVHLEKMVTQEGLDPGQKEKKGLLLDLF